jgi:iron complex transport system permease protein
VFRNPLADPYLLGVAAGAGLGATVAIAYAPPGSRAGELLPLSAFAGAILGVAFAYLLGRSLGAVRTSGTLILAGVTVAAFMTAAQTFVQQQHAQTLLSVYSWLLGGFGSADWHDVVLVSPYIAVSTAVLLLHRRILDVLSLGDEEAGSLGVNIQRVRLLIVIAATVGTAAAVSVSGLIGFVGIIVPHTIRLLMSTSYRAVVPLSLVVGAGFLVLTDVIARTVLSPQELPIGVITAFLGAPFFAIVLKASRTIR